MAIRPQKIPSLDPQIAPDGLAQTEMIFQDVCQNAMQFYNKHKAYYDKKNQCPKTQTSRLRLGLTGKRGSPRKQNYLYRFSVGWTLFY